MVWNEKVQVLTLAVRLVYPNAETGVQPQRISCGFTLGTVTTVPLRESYVSSLRQLFLHNNSIHMLSPPYRLSPYRWSQGKQRSPPHFPTAVLLGPAAYFPSIIYSVVGSDNCMVKFGGDPCFGTLVFGRRGLERERNAMQYVGKPRASLSPPTSVEWT